MKRKKIFTLANTAFFSVMALSAFSQQSINVAGRSAQLNGLQFDYSIGEMTLVSTERQANLIVTQGLLQPTGSGSGTLSEQGSTGIPFNCDLIKVYPNPTRDILFVQSNEASDVNVGYQLMDAGGNLVINELAAWKAGLNQFTVDLQSFAAGTYFLIIKKTDSRGQQEKISFKVQKTN